MHLHPKSCQRRPLHPSKTSHVAEVSVGTHYELDVYKDVSTGDQKWLATLHIAGVILVSFGVAKFLHELCWGIPDSHWDR